MPVLYGGRGIQREDAERAEAQRREARAAALQRQHRYEREIDAEADRVEAEHKARASAPPVDPVTARLEAIEQRDRLLSGPRVSEAVSHEDARKRGDVFVRLRERERMVAEDSVSVGEARERVRVAGRVNAERELARVVT